MQEFVLQTADATELSVVQRPAQRVELISHRLHLPRSRPDSQFEILDIVHLNTELFGEDGKQSGVVTGLDVFLVRLRLGRLFRRRRSVGGLGDQAHDWLWR